MFSLGMGSDLGIDLGTATVLVYAKGKGIVVKEPSIVAIDKNNNQVIAVGEEARRMIGRTPGNIVAVRPLRDGVISDYDVTERMLKHFIAKSSSKARISAPKVMICIPSQATEVEKRAVIDAVRNSGAKSGCLIEEPLAAAVGAGIDVTLPNGNLIIDIGGGTTDIALISLGGIVVRRSIKVAGDKFDEAIIRHIRNKYKLLIGERTAEDIKINIATVFEGSRSLKTTVRGRNLITGLPDNIEITTEEIAAALKEPTRAIVDAVTSVLEQAPPELAGDILENGMLLTGGGSLLDGLDKLIEYSTGVETRNIPDSVEAVVLGIGKILSSMSSSDLSIENKEVALIESENNNPLK